MATMYRALRTAAAGALFLLAAFVVLPAAAQTFYESVAAYDRGDYATAWRGFHRIANQGNTGAQVYLGYMSYYGEGVPRNYVEAVKWYRRAAEQGNAYAQVNLGTMYFNGEGVPRNYVEAVKWYRRAAEHGDASAQANLGHQYEFGLGILKDYVLAHMWYNLAVMGTPAGETGLRNWAKQRRDDVARHLSRADLARAQRMARERRGGTGREAPSPAPRADDADDEALVWGTTARAIAEAPSPAPRADDGDVWNRIVEVQHTLARLGYAPGPADGVLNPETRRAIRAFQAAAGLPADGQLSERLESALLSALRTAAAPAPTPARRPLEPVSTGSGFRVTAEGHILTNAHVVRGCAEVRVPPAGAVAVAARDEASDLALLDGPAGGAVAAFRQGRGIRPGAGVIVIGYPLRGALASGAQVAVGNVSALAGPGDDRRLIQITAPAQPGNSGGPVLDSSGNAVGVVVSKLDAIAMARATGDIPQNVNFAVSAGAARAFLDSEGVAYETAPSDEARAPDDIAAAARAFAVLVECWN